MLSSKKRLKSSCEDDSNVNLSSLSHALPYSISNVNLSALSHELLLQVAQKMISSSPAAAAAAADVIRLSEKRKEHCKRCHQSFDPYTADSNACVIYEHDESEGMIRASSSNGWDDFIYPCCKKREGSTEACWKGAHTTYSNDLSALNVANCWKDELYLDNDGCYGCNIECNDCCTCCDEDEHEVVYINDSESSD
eukprot:Pgem_evm1s10293